MFKIISAETKKILSKPGIYILSVLLALILVFGVFIYKPVVYESSQFVLDGDTYLQKYTDFARGENAGKKAEGQTKLNSITHAVQSYVVESAGGVSMQVYVEKLISDFDKNYSTYLSCASENAYQSYIDSTRTKLVSSLELLNSTIEDALINSQNGAYTILTSSNNYNQYKAIFKEVLAWAKVNIQKENLLNHFNEFENNYKETFYNCLKEFKYPTLSAEFIKTHTENTSGTRLFIINERINSILNEIDANHALATTNSDDANIKLADKMDILANEYMNTIDTYVNLVKYELICNAFSILSTPEQLNTMYLTDHSNYNSKSLLARYEFLFENNKTENDYCRPLTIGLASNDYTNAYDYAYFVLKIFSFVIIIYAIMSACHSIAGEIKDGTMRYLAIRPVPRTKMLLGKWLAIIYMSTILILFSAIISICVGGAVYGFSSKTILTIFNGSAALTLHPMAMIGIYLVSMLLELIVYSSIAMFMSTIFKSDLLGMTLMMMLYLLNILLPMFVQGSNTWLAFYPFSHLSLYALFGSSVYAVSGNFFNLIFGAKVYAGTHIMLTISILVLLTAIAGALAIKIFSKKEL